MSQLLQLLVTALGSGDVTLHVGQITGRCGYTDWANRTVVLNPDASPEQLAAQLRHSLELLIPIPEQRHDEPTGGHLRLVRDCDPDDETCCPHADASGE